MPKLAEFQSRFKEAVFNPTPGASIIDWVDDDGLVEDRLNVYRNNVFYSLSDALSDFYPVVTKLVGEDFFWAMAAAFVRDYPPKSGRILEYGAGFPGFIATFEPAKSLVYLSDVAQLEWAWHEAYHAADAEALDPAELQKFPPERMADLTFTLHPSAQRLLSPYPIDRIWVMNQDGAEEETLNLEIGSAYILVIRPDEEVEIRSFTLGGYAFLEALYKGQTLGEAFEIAAAKEPDLDLTALLGGLLQGKTFINASLEE